MPYGYGYGYGRQSLKAEMRGQTRCFEIKHQLKAFAST